MAKATHFGYGRVRRFTASKELVRVMELFSELSQDERLLFVHGLPAYLIEGHEAVKWLKPRRRGKPDRDREILKLCDKMSDGQIAKRFGMTRDAVQGVRRRHGKKKR